VARRAAATVLAALGDRPRGLVVDLGCGSGILARALTDAGWPVLGVDPSPAMLAIASEQAPAATFVCGSLVDVELPPCAAVTAVGEILNYALADRAGLRDVLGRIAGALAPGGVLVLDLAGPGRAGPERVRHAAHEAGGWSLRARAEEDRTGTTLTRVIRLARQVGDRVEESVERHVLRLFRPEEVEADVAAAGFDVRRIDGYGDVAFLPGWAGFVAVRG
jgi:SAM-dependent methyltransferase